MNSNLDRVVLVSILLLQVFAVSSQTITGNKRPVLYLNQDSTRYLAFSAGLQFWLRSTENNPGSLVFDNPRSVVNDVSIRRLRLGLSGFLTERLYFFTLMGFNNLNYLSNGKASIDLLDAHVEYQFHRSFHMGVGKMAWGGASRQSTPHPNTLLGYDLQSLSIPMVNLTDNLMRRLGVYVKGKIGKLDYRAAVGKPTALQNTALDLKPQEGISTFADLPDEIFVTTYLKYDFWEVESNLIPFFHGTYLGKKRVMALGAGYEYQANEFWSLRNGDLLTHDLHLFGLDYFLELPVPDDMALNFYAVYHYYDMGPNFVRNIGFNNPANGVDPQLSSFNGPGNSFPQAGSGQSVFWQAGWLFPEFKKFPSWVRFQPYFSMQISDFERLDDHMIYYDYGFNWLFAGHAAKLSFNVQNRPIFFDTSAGLTVEDRKNMYVLQLSFVIN
jgi:hypothetical protein